MKYLITILITIALTAVGLLALGHQSFQFYAKEALSSQATAQEIDTSAVNEIVEMIQELESRIEQEDVSSEQEKRLREKLRNRIEESYQTSISTQQYQEFIEAWKESVQEENSAETTEPVTSQNIIMKVDSDNQLFELSDSGIKVNKWDSEQFEINENGMFVKDGDTSFELSDQGMKITTPDGENIQIGAEWMNMIFEE